MCYYLFTVPSSAPPFNVTVLNSTAVNVSWQVVNPLFLLSISNEFPAPLTPLSKVFFKIALLYNTQKRQY